MNSRLLSLVVCALVGTQAIKMKAKLRPQITAEVGTSGGHTCSTAVDRLFNTEPVNAASVISLGKKFNDPTFPPQNDDALYWPDLPSAYNSLESYAPNVEWHRISDLAGSTVEADISNFWLNGYEGTEDPTLFGPHLRPHDMI